jgi:nucleoside-diphosphate-sugar epimerase
MFAMVKETCPLPRLISIPVYLLTGTTLGLVATAHVLAFEKPEAANQRYLISSTAYNYQQVCDIIREKFPELRALTPKGKSGEPLPDVYQLDTSKAVNQLGMVFTPLEKTVVDTVNNLLELQKKLSGS